MFVEGGCFCGLVRYKFESNNYPSANCHCSICRRISGAAFVSWVRVPNDCFEYISCEPKKIESSYHVFDILRKKNKGSFKGLEIVYDEIHQRLFKIKEMQLLNIFLDSLYISADIYISPEVGK